MGIAVFWLLFLFGVAMQRHGRVTHLASMQPHNCLFRGREFISFCGVASALRAAGASIQQTVAEYSAAAAGTSGQLPGKHLELS